MVRVKMVHVTVSWKDLLSNVSIIEELGPQCRRLTEAQSHKLKYFGHLVGPKICLHQSDMGALKAREQKEDG